VILASLEVALEPYSKMPSDGSGTMDSLTPRPATQPFRVSRPMAAPDSRPRLAPIAACTPRVTVSPAGAVTRVEITGSSGYTEIDARVEAALREFLFSREEGGNDAVGTITFRYRLEKRD